MWLCRSVFGGRVWDVSYIFVQSPCNTIGEGLYVLQTPHLVEQWQHVVLHESSREEDCQFHVLSIPILALLCSLVQMYGFALQGYAESGDIYHAQ